MMLGSDPWWRVLALSAGGVLGVNARYWLGVWIDRWADPRFPWATVSINVTGCFAIGLIVTALAAWLPHPHARLFAVTGFLGGYTTFSSFALESLTLWERGHFGLALGNMIGSVAAGVVAVAVGAALARGVVGTAAAPSAPGHVHVPVAGAGPGPRAPDAPEVDRPGNRLDGSGRAP